MKKFYYKYLIFRRIKSWMGFFIWMNNWKKASKECATMKRLDLNKWYFWTLASIW